MHGLARRASACANRRPAASWNQALQKAVDVSEMLLPGRYLEAADACQLCVARGTRSVRVGFDACKPAGTVERIEIIGNVARDFVKYAQVACEYGRAQRQRFHEGHPISFDERRKQQCPRMHEPRAQLIVRAIRHLDNGSLEVCAAFEHIHDVFAFPAAPSDDHEFGRLRAELFDELPPYVQHEPMILARLDRAEHDEIGRVQRALRIRARSDAGREPRDHRGRKR